MLKTLKNYWEKKMSIRLNIRMSKTMHTLIKVGISTYATYANCRTM